MRLALLAASLGLASCSILTDSFQTDDFSGDPFPIHVDLSTGAVVLGVREAGHTDRAAILDLMSPISILDSGSDATPDVIYDPIDLLGQDPGTGMFDLARAQLPMPRLIEIHPCETAPCVVGTPATTAEYQAIIGGDVMAGDAVRLQLKDDEIFVLANVAGDNPHRGHACDAVFPSPYRGGGTLIIGGTELAFSNFRPVLQACIAFDPDTATKLQSNRGVDALFVGSTGVGTSLLGESAYERFRAEQKDATGVEPPAADALPADTVTLASGVIAGHRTTLPSLALVGDSATNRSPCRQVYAHHLLATADCAASVQDDPAGDCPCNGTDTFCAVPGIAELSPAAGFDVLVISDDDPTLQALRAELRPDQQEVDGILGTSALRSAQVDADYPHDRMLFRCAAHDPECRIRPELDHLTDRDSVNGCIAGSGPPIGGGPIN